MAHGHIPLANVTGAGMSLWPKLSLECHVWDFKGKEDSFLAMGLSLVLWGGYHVT